jgi:hypothetical protein
VTRDEWRRAEPILTRALLLPEPERETLLETADLEEALRRDLMEILRQSFAGSANVAVAGSLQHSPPSAPQPIAPPAVRRLPALPPNAKLADGRYTVVRQIGRGGMGTVFLGHDTVFGTLVALKIMPYDERVLAEARRAAVCSDHPHVATIHNVLKEQIDDLEIGVLVMEYVAGTPASQLLDDGPVEVGRVLKWGREVASAIGHAHDHQVLHCDLKPGNIVITADDRAKVLDFGISRATFDPSDPSEPLRGTMPYMAPEQLLSKQFSPAGDIYSLGVTLFELVTGRLPFEGGGGLLRLQILGAPPPDATELVPDVPEQLQKVFERAMAKEPERRFRSARSFERALDAIEGGVQYTTATVPVPVRRVQAPLSVWGRIGIGIVAFMSAVLALMALGAYTSTIYNQTLERADFANESVWDWLKWGFHASTGPLAILIITILGWVIVRSVWNLALRVFDHEGRLQRQASASSMRILERLGIDDLSARSAAALIGSATALAIAVFLNRDLFPAFVSFAATSEPERLELLSPQYYGRNNAFRREFSLVVIVSVAAWYSALKTRERRRRAPRGVLVAGLVTLLLALVLLHHPHRLMFSEVSTGGVEVVRYQGHDCYVLGQRGSDTLLLCPEFSPLEERHRIVRTGEPAVVPLGKRESVFTGFYRVAERKRQQAAR